MTISENDNYKTVHDERFIWDERLAATVFGVLAAFTLSFTCFFVVDFRRKLCKRRIPTISYTFVGLVFWSISFMLMAFYCCHLDLNIKHEYYGPVQITGYTLRENTTTSKCGEYSKCISRYVAANLSAKWGYAWACPAAPQRRCRSYIEVCKFRICKDYNCNDKKTEKAHNKAIACAEEYFNSSMKYAPFDPKSGPSQDENWPSLLAYPLRVMEREKVEKDEDLWCDVLLRWSFSVPAGLCPLGTIDFRSQIDHPPKFETKPDGSHRCGKLPWCFWCF